MSRLSVVGAFLAGVLLVAACVVVYGPGPDMPTLAEKKAMLKVAAQKQMLLVDEPYTTEQKPIKQILLLNEAGDYYSWEDQSKVIAARENASMDQWKNFRFCGAREGGRYCHFGAFNNYIEGQYWGDDLDICNGIDASGCNGKATWRRFASFMDCYCYTFLSLLRFIFSPS